MRSRSEVRASKTSKPSAAERTVPIPGTEETKPKLGHQCRDCDEYIAPGGSSSVRTDGQLECPECGGILEPAKALPESITSPDSGTKTKIPSTNGLEYADAAAVMPKGELTPKQFIDAKRTPIGKNPPPQAFCNECGEPWPRVEDRPVPTCGHSDGFVYKPSEARRHKAMLEEIRNAKTEAPKPEATKPEVPPTSKPEIVKGDPRDGHVILPMVRIEWGKSTFQPQAYSTFTVGPFSMEVPIGEEHTARAKLKELASIAFQEQLEWYAEKLGVMEKKFGIK